MALLNGVFPKLYWIVVLTFQLAQSIDVDSVEPEDEKETLVICENNENYIECPYGIITIKNAYYGRTETQTCPGGQTYDTNCKAPNALSIIRNKCENKAKCHLEATNNLFGDPCPNTNKYLRVDFICSKANRIHKELICESNSKEIKCPEGTTIKINNASYGRMDKNVCPHQSTQTTNCSAENSSSIVKKRCENKKECHLEASNSWFNDPCVGTHKYLSVEYQCVQANRIHTELICESSSKEIRCSEGKTIKINNASYGRMDKNVCPHQNIKTTNCSAENSSSIVKKRCENKEKCHVEASNSWFNDPCIGTHKYLSVEYQCVEAQSIDVDSVEPEDEKETLVICENNENYIECPYGIITIKNAYYGRTETQTCPGGQTYDTNCKAPNALSIIRNKCENKAKCHLEATNNLFGDPCPNTNKYLRVDFICSKANRIHKELICESNSKEIKCPEGTTIKINNASYGRMDKNVCPHQSTQTTNCSAENSSSIVKKRCENKKECHLEASNSLFNDPCVGTHKYLSVEYQCVQETIYKPQKVTVCESKTQKINCPQGSNLIIEDAFYGRLDKITCPHAQMSDVECKASNAFQIVNERCKNKSECELQSTNSWFGDPCVGTHKYLQVKYKCV